MKLDEQHSIIPNSILASPKAIIEISARPYVDILHENSTNRPKLSSLFNDQDNEFDINSSTKLDSITAIRHLNSNYELTNKIIWITQ